MHAARMDEVGFAREVGACDAAAQESGHDLCCVA